MNDKRPIDRIREAAGMMQVGTADDASAIKEAFTIGGVLHIIKEKGIYVCKLADQIDPARTNPNIPNVQQRVLTYGTDSPLVRQTLLTAKKLFNPSYLPEAIDCDKALLLTLQSLHDLASMQDIAMVFTTARDKAVLEDRRNKDGSVVLPRVGDVNALCKSFIQKADHALQSALGIVKLFYGPAAGKGWFESLKEITETRYGVDDPFARFMKDALPFLKLVRNARNCVEHPKPGEQIIVNDFELNNKMQIVPPLIEIIHPKTPQPEMHISQFGSQVIEQISNIFEMLIAFLCDRHVRTDLGLQFQVINLPEEWQAAQHVRYSYGLYDGERVIPAG